MYTSSMITRMLVLLFFGMLSNSCSPDGVELPDDYNPVIQTLKPIYPIATDSILQQEIPLDSLQIH